MRFVGGEPKVLACLLLLLRDSSVAHNLERVNRQMFVWIYKRKADYDGTRNIILLYNLALPSRSVQRHSNIFLAEVNSKLRPEQRWP
jgi:hypothetical protein